MYENELNSMYDLESQMKVMIESTPSFRKINNELDSDRPRSNAVFRKKNSLKKQTIQQQGKVIRS